MSEFNLADVLDHPEWLEYSSEDGDISASEDNRYSNDSASEYGSDEEDNDKKTKTKNISKLSAFVNSLGGQNVDEMDSNGAEDSAQHQRKKRRIVVPEKQDLRPENTFASISSSNQKLSFQDILSTLPTEQRATAKKTFKMFTPDVSATPDATETSSATEKKSKDDKKKATGESVSKKRKSIMKESGPLAVPLPQTVQAKINRRAANEVLEENIDNWDETVREMKGISRAGQDPNENRLTLPLQVNKDTGTNNEQLSSKFKPSNSLESSIHSLLTSAKLTGKDNTKAETEAFNSLPQAAAVDSRQKIYELRQHRELMYRAERKAKLLAKIKSKTYRRILRHSKAKKASALGGDDNNIDHMSVEQMIEMDQIDGGDRLARAMEKREMERIKERMTLKHASKRGGGRKWAQSMAGMMGSDDEASLALRDRADRESQLRKKISNVGGPGDGSSDSDDNDSDNSDEDSDEMDQDTIRQNAFDELQQVLKDENDNQNQSKPKGIMGMKFMQRGVEAERNRLKEETEAFERELQEQFGAENEDDDDDESAPKLPSHQRVEGNVGRRVIVPQKSSVGSKREENDEPVMQFNDVKGDNDEEEEDEDEEDEDDTEIILHQEKKKMKKGLHRYHQREEQNEDEDNANPWLGATKAQKKYSGQQQLVGAGKEGRKVANKVAKVKAATEEAREAAKEDARVSIDLSNVMTANQKHQSKLKQEIEQKDAQIQDNKVTIISKAEKKPKTKKNFKGKGDDHKEKGNVRVAGSDSDDSEKEDEPVHISGKNRTSIALSQRDMVARAFANDDVVMEFEKEKQTEIERDAPREEDITLPGWGSWGGKGVKGSQNHKKKFTKKIDGIDASKRKDAKLKNVIINERADKKARKYLVNDLPFPYTSAAQHEYKLTRPMGPEWTTNSIHRNNTAPSVLTKPGTVISPIDRLVT